ncbi:hypothetical protein LEP1GSC163_2133 [Leptospira santarosai str. CBC379]|uniref:Uncharacterized protein n=1 Tax=Leptospira santarosai str. MOR084 TaxID=1049984 RepID=A0A0E2BJX0_9LEPT|nr:hypothetical protein LEP1GSC179_1272 [Leptospira santarosai str. MOR084]EKR92893.1 hypothetical protein LEP1GSC163_2133 [Leptospira santarosai str. CBC379]
MNFLPGFQSSGQPRKGIQNFTERSMESNDFLKTSCLIL